MVTKEQLVCGRLLAAEIAKKLGNDSSIFSWQQFSDSYGPGWMVEERFSQHEHPAFTVAEMMQHLPGGLIQKIIFYLKTNLEPDKVAKYLISKL